MSGLSKSKLHEATRKHPNCARIHQAVATWAGNSNPQHTHVAKIKQKEFYSIT
ncbi:hypothetical protein ACLOJK_014738, partial [Asimina triloba]